MRETADFEVTREHEDAPFAQFRHDARECKASDSRADDDGIEFPLRRHCGDSLIKRRLLGATYVPFAGIFVS